MEILLESTSPFFTWLWRASWQASVLIVLVLLAQWILRKQLRPAWRHGLWLLVILRLALPWSLESRVSVFNWLRAAPALPSVVAPETIPEQVLGKPSPEKPTPNHPSPGLTSGARKTAAAVSASTAPAVASSLGTLRTWLPWLWLTGAVVLPSYLVITTRRLGRRVRRQRPLTDAAVLDVLEDCKQEMGMCTPLALLETAEVTSPSLYGFVRPRLLLPAGLTQGFSQPELRYVFLHELSHIKRGDIPMNWLTTGLLILHWFNPLVWYAFHRLRVDRELACDALALSFTGEAENQSYGQTIIKLLEGFSRPGLAPGLVGILEDMKQMKRRISMIAKFKRRNRWPVIAVLAFASLALIALTDAQTSRESPKAATIEAGYQKGSVAQVDTGKSAPAQIATNNSEVITDEKTGIRFTKFKTISGPNDVIEYVAGLNLSPNGKFLLYDVRVIPIDGGQSFNLVTMANAGHASWSPDGRKVVFYAGAIWLIGVDPETGRPAGPARKLLEGQYYSQHRVYWSSDSRRIRFLRRDSQVHDQMWTLSIETGELSPLDPASFGLVSPDGKSLAYLDNGVWVKLVDGGAPTRVGDGGILAKWSDDGKWLVSYGQTYAPDWPTAVWFLRPATKLEKKVTPPSEAGVCVGMSADRKKLLFYRSSYDFGMGINVVSALGGSSSQPLPVQGRTRWICWSPDSTRLILGLRKQFPGGSEELTITDLSGGQARPMNVDLPGIGKLIYPVFSPDCAKVVGYVKRSSGERELLVAPFSLQAGRISGPPHSIFKGSGVEKDWWLPVIWSPDGSRIAVWYQKNIWIASPSGGESMQLTNTASDKSLPLWSPDGKMLAYESLSSPGNPQLEVVSLSGGEAKAIPGVRLPGWWENYAWAREGRQITVALEGSIYSVSLTGDKEPPLVDLKQLGVDMYFRFSWSPDGHDLAFLARKEGDSNKLYVFRRESGKTEQLATDFQNKFGAWWSPDGKWLAYECDSYFKKRPEGVLWAMDIEEALTKLSN